MMKSDDFFTWNSAWCWNFSRWGKLSCFLYTVYLRLLKMAPVILHQYCLVRLDKTRCCIILVHYFTSICIWTLWHLYQIFLWPCFRLFLYFFTRLLLSMEPSDGFLQNIWIFNPFMLLFADFRLSLLIKLINVILNSFERLDWDILIFESSKWVLSRNAIDRRRSLFAKKSLHWQTLFLVLINTIIMRFFFWLILIIKCPEILLFVFLKVLGIILSLQFWYHWWSIR